MSEGRRALPGVREPIPRVAARSQRAWNRFLLTALALHVPLFIYPVVRICMWLGAPWWLTLIVLLPLASSQIVSRLYLRGREGVAARTWKWLADFWLGLSPILLMTLLVFEMVVLAGWLETGTAALLTLGITAALGGVGVLAAIVPHVRTVHLGSAKVSAPLRFVQITDVHIGSRGRRFLEQVIYRVNRLEPDFLCITGDFIDRTGVPVESLQSLRSVLFPVYFSIGNHERYEDLEEIQARLTSLGVTVLRNATVIHEERVQVIGIDDREDEHQVRRELEAIDMDHERFVLLLYHRPRGLEDAAAAGVDLMLSGHTHNGQIFPFNLVVGRVFDRVVGLFELGGTHLYVSQGTGTWGPVLRLGTRAEITQFVITPN